MVEGTIQKLDLSNREAVIEDAEGREIVVRFTERANVEIIEPETVGLMGGELEDLEEGYLVELELSAKREDGSFVCDSVTCIS